MPDRSLRALPTILAASALLSACGAAGPIGSAPVSPPATALSSPATDVAEPPPTAPPAAPSPSTAQPPAASLAVEGGDPVTGQLGSFTWDGGGSDSPWLPGSPITVAAGERITISLAAAAGITGWTARRVPAGTPDDGGAVALGEGDGPVAFSAPPPGTWSVQLTIQFAGDRGSAAYYWRIAVS